MALLIAPGLEEGPEILTYKNTYDGSYERPFEISEKVIAMVYQCYAELSWTAYFGQTPIGALRINEYENYIINADRAIRRFRGRSTDDDQYLSIIEIEWKYSIELMKELKARGINKVAHITGLMVVAEWRTSAIATMMLTMAKRQLKDEGYQAVIFEMTSPIVRQVAQKFGAQKLVSYPWRETFGINSNNVDDIWIYYL